MASQDVFLYLRPHEAPMNPPGVQVSESDWVRPDRVISVEKGKTGIFVHYEVGQKVETIQSYWDINKILKRLGW